MDNKTATDGTPTEALTYLTPAQQDRLPALAGDPRVRPATTSGTLVGRIAGRHRAS